MKAATYSENGNPFEVLGVSDVAIPEVGQGEVLIKTILAPIHFHNLAMISGTYGINPPRPAIGGTEAVGTIEKLGPDVEGLKVGQRVATGTAVGTWAEYFKISAESVIPIPASISDEAAAQIVTMPVSAVVLLDTLGLKSGDWVAFNSANGAVGSFAAAIAKDRGINMVKIVRRAEAKAQLERQGYDLVFSSEDPEWVKQVHEVSKGLIKVAVDSIGGAASSQLFEVLGNGGELVSFGSVTAQPLQVSPGGLIFQQKTVRGWWLTSEMSHLGPKRVAGVLKEVFGAIASGKVKLSVGKVVPLDNVKDAIKASTEAKNGKILLRP